jgi:hypothetical protein
MEFLCGNSYSDTDIPCTSTCSLKPINKVTDIDLIRCCCAYIWLSIVSDEDIVISIILCRSSEISEIGIVVSITCETCLISEYSIVRARSPSSLSCLMSDGSIALTTCPVRRHHIISDTDILSSADEVIERSISYGDIISSCSDIISCSSSYRSIIVTICDSSDSLVSESSIIESGIE